MLLTQNHDSDTCKNVEKKAGFLFQNCSAGGISFGLMGIIAERIRLKREQLGLTQAQLGKLVGVSPKQIYKWERGRDEPGSGRISVLAQALEVDSRWLLTGVEQRAQLTTNGVSNGAPAPAWMPNVSAGDLALLEKIQNLPPVERKIVEQLVLDLAARAPARNGVAPKRAPGA